MNIENFTSRYSFPLDQFQLDAINALTNSESVLVSAPTGSGKTVIAEFGVFDAFEKNKKIVYTTPLKALSNQKYRDFLSQYPENRVGLITGDANINQNAPLVIMTTEILRNILYQDKSRLDNVEYIIIDECHYMNDQDRGTVWEETIIHCPEHIKIIALSATIANSEEIASWIASLRHNIRLIEYNIRPVPLYHYCYIGGKLLPFFDENKNVNSQLNGHFSKLENLKKRKRSNEYIHETSLGLLRRLHNSDMLPAIFFIFSRQGCEDVMINFLNNGVSFTTAEEHDEIVDHIKKKLEEYPSLKETGASTNLVLRALPMGMAVHHAGLVPILRSFIEVLFQKGLIKIVFATETLAAGINMPARTTIISSLSKRGDNGHRPLTVNEFTQMTGRAGRRGKDSRGNCIVLYDGQQTLYDVRNVITGDLEPINSHFSLSYNMILNLLGNFQFSQIPPVLKLSFGQYLMNKDIINLQLEISGWEGRLKQLQKKTHNQSLEKKVKKVERKIRIIGRQIERQQNVYLNNFYNLLKVLKHFDQLVSVDKNNYLLTPSGQLTSYIRARNDLIISLMLLSPEVEELSSIELAAFLGSLTYEPRRESKEPAIIRSKILKHAFVRALNLRNRIEDVQEDNGINMPVTIERGIIPIVMKWGTGCRWEEMKEEANLDDGDLIRAFRQLIDLLHQLERIQILPEALMLKIKDAIRRLDRDILQIIV